MRMRLSAAAVSTNNHSTRARPVTGLAQRADDLDPAEAFLDALALAEGIAGVTGGTAIDRRASVGVVL
jgi:hypothetical protein